MIHPVAVAKEKVLVLGAGRSGRALYQLLKGKISPYKVVGFLEAKLKGINILEMPTVFEKMTGRVPVRHIQDEWLLFAGGFYLISKDYVQKIKRLFDFTFLLGAKMTDLSMVYRKCSRQKNV